MDESHTEAQGGAGFAENDGVTVVDLAKSVWHRKYWVVGPLVALVALTFVYVSTLAPRYTSEADILIEDTQSVFARAEGETPDRAQADPQDIESHVQLLNARDLAASVIRELKLAELPEFDFLKNGISLPKRLLVLIGVVRDPRLLSAEERAMKVYYSRLSADKLANSRVIAVRFTSIDPVLAAKVANAIADNYLALQFDAKRQSTFQAAQWLGEQVGELRKNVEEAEAKVEEYKSVNGLLRGVGESSLTLQQLSELNSQLIVARTQRAEAQARAQTIRELIRSGGDLSSASEVLSSPLIQRLLEQQVTLGRSIAELSPTLLPQHPRMRELNAELADLKRQIRGEAEKVSIGLENEARVAGARENAIRQSLNALKQEAEKANVHEVELRALEREARAQRDLLESFLARFREASARNDRQSLAATARIVSRAMVSNEPSYPLKGPILAIVAIATLIVGVGVISSMEIMRAMSGEWPSARFVPQPQVVDANTKSDAAATPALAKQPAVRAVSAPAGTDAQSFPEPVRALARLLIERAAAEGSVRLLVTTPQRQTRDNFTAVNLARLLTAMNIPTVLIDANLRTPHIADQLGISEVPGLSELLSGTSSFADVIRRDPGSRLHVISAGAQQFDPMPLIGADRVERVFDALEGSYRFILIDSPPVMLSPETRALTNHADIAVLVGDSLPGAQRLIERARDMICDKDNSPIDVVVAKPEVARPIEGGSDDDLRVA
jgi:exopolysaccharide transport family protein